MDPEILALDGPSSNLDPRSRGEFGEILAQLDLAMLLVTHDPPLCAGAVRPRCNHRPGAIVANGPIRDVLADEPLLAAHALELPAGFSLVPFGHG